MEKEKTKKSGVGEDYEESSWVIVIVGWIGKGGGLAAWAET